MGIAKGYILSLTAERRDVFNESVEEYAIFSEPVAEFSHSRNVPLICFVVSDDGIITHIASGKRGVRAGTELRRLNLKNIKRLQEKVSSSGVIEHVPHRVKGFIKNYFQSGGLLPPKSFEALVEALKELAPSSGTILDRFNKERVSRIRRLSEGTRVALAQQKEAVTTALSIARLPREPLQQWTPVSDEEPVSFLEGLSSAKLREDPMVIHDLINLPGYDLIKTLPYNASIFEGESERLTVILANRQPLEQQLGTDLIYFNETYSSFIMVQYKAMERENDETMYRFPNKQLDEEIERMDKVLSELQSCDPDNSVGGYRLNDSPFFLKFCSRLVFNPDDMGLIPGIYVPLDYWRLLSCCETLKGPRGGKRLTYKNVQRYFDNSAFVTLVTNAWVGTDVNQSNVLKKVIEQTLETGKAVALAVKTVTA